MSLETLPAILHRRARSQGHETAFIYLANAGVEQRRLSWAELDNRAAAIGAELGNRAAAGERVLIAMPSGLELVEAVFGCWYAGAVPVPVCLPRRRSGLQRLASIIANADPGTVLCTDRSRAFMRSEDGSVPFDSKMRWISVDEIVAICDTFDSTPLCGRAGELALLQYTSGSTADPKGVMVTHGNLIHNCALIVDACGLTPGDTFVGWLPLYHDMGLIGLALQPVFAGVRSVLMSPESFLMHPVRWLQAIDRYDASGSSAPNMAYDLCAQRVTEEQKSTLDLSRWRKALNGAEPVRAGTLERFEAAFGRCGFQPSAWLPCYGLAESTLMVSGGVDNDRPRIWGTMRHVSCGRVLGGQQMVIVDPHTCGLLPEGEVGEIWLRGASCAAGYWHNETNTRETFEAFLADSEGPWLRTGDLGFLRDGELFVTGRLREIIIVAGRNHFPVDIEQSAETDIALANGACAAFAIELDACEHLALVAELDRDYWRNNVRNAPAFDPSDIYLRLRRTIADEHGLTPKDILLLRPGAIARTTSGKIQRSRCRDAYLKGELETIGEIN